MKKIVAVVVMFVFGAVLFTACGNPCDKAYTKSKKCADSKIEKALYETKEFKKLWNKACKKADKGEIKKCLDKGCAKFSTCIGKAVK
jgi:hypothetical protein